MSPRTRDHRFIIAMVILAGILRLYRLGNQSLWIDEIFTFAVSSPKTGLNIWDYLKYNLHGPLHSLIVYLFQLVSKSDAWLRLPSALAGTASVYLFYRWIDVWLGRNIARVSALLLAIHPLHIHYSQELRNYGFLILFAMMANFFFHRSLGDEERQRNWFFYVVTLALSALSNFTAAFLYTAHTLIYFLRKGIKKSTVLRWILVSVAVLVLISPWVYRIYKVIDVSALVTPVMPGQLSTTERLRGETTVTFTALPYTAYTFSVGFSMGPSLRELHREHTLVRVIADHALVVVWVGLLFGTLLIYGAVILARRRRELLETGIYLLFPIILTLLLCWQNAKAFNVRYVLLSLPLYLSLVSTALSALPKRLVAVVWFCVMTTICASVGNYYYNARYAKEDLRSAANYIESHADSEDCLLVPTVKEVFKHYYDGTNPVYEVYAPAGTPKERVEDRLTDLFARCNSYWYIRAREWVDDPDNYLIDILSERSVPVESVDFTGVRLIRFIKKNSAPR